MADVFLQLDGPRSNDYGLMVLQGKAILRAHERHVQQVVDGGAQVCHIYMRNSGLPSSTTVTGFAANCPPHMVSDVGHALATQSGTFGLLWYVDKNGKCWCSLRSNGNVDVSAIAQHFGGGGHKKAAGFTIDIQTLLSWLGPR